MTLFHSQFRDTISTHYFFTHNFTHKIVTLHTHYTDTTHNFTLHTLFHDAIS